MRRLVVTENITLDGVIDAEGGWFLPSGETHIDESDVLAALQQQAAASDGFLTGRVTFEEMRGYWPLQADDTTGNTEHLNRVEKYVVSATMTDPQWKNSTVLSGPLVEEIEAIKAQPGTDIVTTGSITLVRDLIAHGLVDEYRLFVFPVVLGKGRRLFDGATDLPSLRLLEMAVRRTWAPAGRQRVPRPHPRRPGRRGDRDAALGRRRALRTPSAPRSRSGRPGRARARGWSTSRRVGDEHAATTEPDRAQAFYGDLFGWQFDTSFGDGIWLCRLPGYVGGEERQPVPRDVVAVIVEAEMPGGPASNADFWIADADKAADDATRLGGSVLEPPHEDVPMFRRTVIADPGGAAFSVSQLLVEF